ncbi:MAG: hypothetical protein ACLUHA_11740 [Bacteroides stercoris]
MRTWTLIGLMCCALSGIMQNYDLSVSNGTEKGNYFFLGIFEE